MDNEYVWDKGTSVTNVMKNLLSSNPKIMLQSAWLHCVNWAKKYLHVCLIH